MKRIISYLSASSNRWPIGMVFLFIVIAFSSCSTSKEASYAYLDDIYNPNNVAAVKPVYVDDTSGGVADQDGSVIKPYQPTVSGYYPTVKPLNFNIGFSYSYYNRWPFNWGYDNYCYRNGWSGNYCNYRRYYPFDWYSPFYVNRNFYSYYPGYHYGDRYFGNSVAGGSYIFRNDVSYFKGINSTDRRTGYAINYAKYSNYRVANSNAETQNGEKNRAKSKNRIQKKYTSPQSTNNKRRTNYSSGSNYRSGSSGGGSNRSSSPSRSSGSSGGSYSGKRPR